MSSTILIDSDILIDAGRGQEQAITFLESSGTAQSLAISIITAMELVIGCQSKAELRSLETFLQRFRIIQINPEISRIAYQLLIEYRLSHGLLIADALIAATAINLETAFVSKNQRDYRFITNLNLIPYRESQ